MPERTDRLEREVAAAFTDVLAPQPGDEARLAAMIGAALGTPPGGPPPPTGVPTPRLWPRLVAAGGLVVAAAVLLATPREPTPQTPVALEPPAATREPTPQTPVALAPEPPAAATREPVVLPPPLAATELAPADAPPQRPRPAMARQEAPMTAPAATPDAEIDPDALLRAANQARRARQFAEADRLYRDLQARFPDTRAARTSHVPHARLLLDTLGRPADALAGFSAYLNADPRGTLSEEALVGRAQALQELGRSGEMRDAWRSLLERFPESVHAPAAQRQIAEARP